MILSVTFIYEATGVPYVRRSVLYAKFYAYNGNGMVG